MSIILIILAFCMSLVSIINGDELKSGIALIMAIQFWVGALVIIALADRRGK